MCCEKEMRPMRLVIALITFLICAFDVSVDWYTFSQFFQVRVSELDKQLTLGLGVVCGVGTLLFLLEIWNCIQAYRTFTSFEDDVSSAEKSLERWTEVVTFFQLILDDCPVTIILYLAYTGGSCELYRELFQDTFTGNLALLAAFVSAVWKVVVSLCYCCCSCCLGVKDCGWQCCCCCCRALRTTVSLLLLAFSAYLFITFNGMGVQFREECLDQ